MKTRWIIPFLMVGLLAGVFTAHWLRQQPGPKAELAAAVIVGPRDLPAVTLQGADGQDLHPDRATANYTLYFFGFTRCPDVCPLALSSLRQFKQALLDGGHAAPRIVFVSVDPMRDTPEIIRQYLDYFDPEFQGATGDTLTLQTLSQAMSVAYEYLPSEDGEDYTVSHTSAFLLVNPAGKFLAIFPSPHQVPALVSDYLKIIR